MPVSTAAVEAPAPKKGNKKLIVIGAAAAVLLVLLGVVAMLLLKKPKNADDEGADSPAPTAKAAAQRDPKAVPVFVPLDSFTVNLADREAERYAQVGITLEVDDAKVGEQIKVYMPAIRNNILMALAEKTAGELMDREGKNKLAEKIRRETSRALGYEVEEPEDAEAEEEDKPKKKSKRRKAEVVLPVTAVHFSNFIIQ
jgi:flagellar protein FliL